MPPNILNILHMLDIPARGLKKKKNEPTHVRQNQFPSGPYGTAERMPAGRVRQAHFLRRVRRLAFEQLP
jgi:hypothetical protein